ncbi:MAG: c-type cytochrome [Sulfurovum sp.]|nr:c-type cytochrome [Sulfurovum sp.]
MFRFYRNFILLVAIMATSVTLFAKSSTATIYTDSSRVYSNGKKVIDGGTTYPVQNKKTSAYFVNEKAHKTSFKLGRAATADEIEAWDIDVMPDGTGLPEGKGTVEEGDTLYETKCASCHFDFGTGGSGYPALHKGNAYEGHKSMLFQRVGGNDEGPIRVFGTYWPYASTLWWYIKTGMPHPAPLSLTDDEVYAICAYILSVNEIKIDGEELDDEYELNREKFLKIKMPNVDGFIPEIRGKNGLENTRKFYNNFANYGNGTRCMKNCFKGKPKLARISGSGISDYQPPLSNKKDLPKKKAGSGSEHPGKKAYEASCSVCHATDAMGAPMVGDKKVWKTILKKGIDKVQHNAIQGINGMPPKGGTSLPDEEIKQIIDYMIKKSK